ncbi:MAG: 1-acyl-sn-glycerol-3-phosphate acyltransferase [Bacteroidia bacterium]
MQEKFIDVDRVFREKNPTAYKWIPRFFMNYLKKIVHQKEINQLLLENKNLYGTDFCRDIIKRWDITLKVHGIENVLTNQGAIFVCNHPLGGMDAIALVDAIAHVRTDIKFIVNDILMNLDNLKGLFVGINRVGTVGAQSLKEVNDLFKSDAAIFLFPAGYVSRHVDGKIQDVEWKKTFVTRSKRDNLPVVPVHLEGELRPFFYRLYKVRTALGIKSNIEMLWLARELYRQHGKTINITFGKPIPSSHFDDGKSDKEWAAWVRSKVYQQAQ